MQLYRHHHHHTPYRHHHSLDTLLSRSTESTSLGASPCLHLPIGCQPRDRLDRLLFERVPFDWPVSVSNILTVRRWAEPNIVGWNFTSRIRPLLINHVVILVRTCRITLWMKILVSQTISRRHAMRQQKKLVHAFATDLKATGPAGQHTINCCGPNWPDDLKNACGPAGT